MKRTHVAALAALVVLAVPTLSGCFSGSEATTNMQATMNSGNGVTADVGPLRIDGATIVMADATPNGTLTARVTNVGAEPDTLVSATINGAPAYITPDGGAIAPGTATSFGYQSQVWINAYGLDVPISSYVPVTLTFEKAGPVDLSVLTVPRAGYYTDVAPNPPTAAS